LRKKSKSYKAARKEVNDMNKEQIDILADFIMEHVGGEPSKDEGAGDTAIRIIKQLQAKNKRLEADNSVLKKFAREIIKNYCWDLAESDGGHIQDLAKKFHLIEQHIATEEDVDAEFCDYEAGDIIYKFTKIIYKFTKILKGSE